MSTAELEHLESQGDEQIGTILGKIGRLKDLRWAGTRPLWEGVANMMVTVV